MALRIPTNLAASPLVDDRPGWVASLPDIVRDAAERWSLDVGDPFEPGGHTAWVAPARTAAGDDVALKLCWRHREAAAEAVALRAWDGDGAVHVLDELDRDDTVVLLLERCVPGSPLRERPEEEQDEVLAALLRRLWSVAVPAGVSSLEDMCAYWADERDAKPNGDLDAGLARDGIELFRMLPASADQQVLLCTDLHAGNVLAAERMRWLVIDPKPHVGDPTYDALQHLLNCPDRLAADPDALVARMAALLDLDTARLRLWAFARCVQESPSWPYLVDVARRLAPST